MWHSTPNINIASKLLDESQTIEDKVNLANEINLAFLEPQKSYLKLSPSCKINTSGHPIPSVTTEMIAKQLSLISVHTKLGFKRFCSHFGSTCFYMLTNVSFKKEQLPLIWKCANITPLPKSSTVNDINTDLRPISLTPTISKIAEEYVVVNHVKPAVIKHIRPDQYGCIPQSSTTHTLINLIHHWSKATDGTSSDVRVLIMDYRKAFDLIDHSLLITKLNDYGINPYIINWICDFLMVRQQRVKMANDIYSEWKDVVAGVPQGTKLGPWLFLIMINDLEISSADGNVIFVDDTTSFEIVEKDKSSSMQLTADEASAWSNVNMFQIQPKKCKELRISFKKNPGTYENITIVSLYFCPPYT